MKSSIYALAVVAALFSSPVAAEVLSTDCPAEFAGGIAPDVVNPKLTDKLRELCYSQFAVFHSGLTATPLFVAQYLSSGLVAQARGIHREDVFHPELQLPQAERSELQHYRSSGFDRGHMAPAGDMATKKSQDESFTLANIIPQMPTLNRGGWADIEETTRRLASRYGEVYVVTGPAFSGTKLSRIGGRVLVPSNVYKAIYVPSTGQASAWWADNATGQMEVISVAELATRIGADVFPAVPPSAKAALLSLPLPGDRPNRRYGKVEKAKADTVGKQPSQGHDGWWEQALVLLVAFLEIFMKAAVRS